MELGEFYKGRRVTVLGSTGLIGSYTVKLLKEVGAKVTAIYYMRPPNQFTRMADVIDCFNLMDLREAKMAVHRAEIVMDLAGVTGGVGLAKEDPTSFVGPNAVLGANVLQACYMEKVERVGFPSSTVVYTSMYRPVREGDLDMNEDPYPLYYGIGWVKRFLEKLCVYYFNLGMKIGLVRPSGAYGRYDNFDERTSHVLPGMISRALRLKPGEDFVVWGDGNDVRDLVHASDIARGLLLAVMLYPNAEPYNIASGSPVTTRELAEMVLKNAPLVGGGLIKFDTRWPSALPYRTVDITKARRALGYEPQVKLEDGISDTVNWYRGDRS